MKIQDAGRKVLDHCPSRSFVWSQAEKPLILFFDIVTVVEISERSKKIRSFASEANRISYHPVKSIIFGIPHLLVNALKVASHALAIPYLVIETNGFQDKHTGWKVKNHLSAFIFDLANLIRNVVQLVPIFGNLCLYGLDRYRIHLIEKELQLKFRNVTTLAFSNKLIGYYANGVFISEDKRNEQQSLVDSLQLSVPKRSSKDNYSPKLEQYESEDNYLKKMNFHLFSN